MLHGVWQRRLADAQPWLVRFINRFHPTSGSQHVLADLYAGPRRRARARLAIRLMHHLARRHPDMQERAAFRRAIGFTVEGHPLLTVDAFVDGRTHHLLPWSFHDPAPVSHILLRDMALFGSPERVRWIVERERLGATGPALRARIRRLLRAPGSQVRNHPDLERWLRALDRMVIAV